MAKEKIVMKNYNGTSWDTMYPRTDGGSVYLDDYVKPAQGGAVVAADTVNAAVGKLEKGLDGKQNVIGYTPENAANKGKANGYAGLDGSGKIPVGLLPQSSGGGLNYKGTLDASAGYPASPSEGDFYIISAPGTISGVEYNNGDWAVYNGAAAGWAKIDNTDAVASVNGMTGAVELTGANLTMAGYMKPAAVGAVTAADTVNAAIGKLERGMDGKQAAGSYVAANGGIAAGTKTKITYDAKGLVTAGADADGRDIAMTGYTKAATVADVAASDSVMTAIGKVEKKTDGKVTGNAAVVGGTKTKITYDAKGLVTAGADATAADFKVGAYAKGAGDVLATDTIGAAIGKVESKADGAARILVQSAEPTGINTGDFWYEVV